MAPAASHEPILVVDDEPLVASTLIELLSVHGFRAESTGTGEDALRILDERRHDLVILDINLPGMNGFETCRAIRRTHGAALPVIMLTALGDAQALREGYEAGTDDFLLKPVDTPLLILKVRAFLRFKAMHDETVRHRQEAQDRARDLAALHGIGRDWSLMAEPAEFYRMVTGRLAALLDARVVGVAHYDPVRREMIPALPVYGIPDDKVAGLAFRLPAGHRALHMFESGQTFVSNRARSEAHLFRELTDQLDLGAILLVPLLANGRVIGVLMAADKPGGFDDADTRLLSIFAGPAGTFLMSREIYQRQERYASRLARLASIAAALAGTSRRKALIDLLVLRVQQDLGYAGVTFLAATDEGLRREAFAGPDAEPASALDLGRAFESALPLPLEAEGRAAALAVPVVGARPLGVLHVVRAEEGPFEDEEVSLLATLGGQLSAALQKAESLEGAEALARRMATLYELGLETAAVRDLRELLLKATEEAGRLIEADHASVFRWHDSAQVLKLFAPWGRPGSHETPARTFRLGHGIAGTVARDWVPVIANDPASLPEFVEGANPVARVICVPLTHYDPEHQAMTLFGVINASRGPGAPPFDKGHLEYLTYFASQLSIAVANSLAFGAEKERSNQLNLVNSLTREIAGSLSRDHIVATTCRRIREAFGFQAVAIAWVDPSGHVHRLGALDVEGGAGVEGDGGVSLVRGKVARAVTDGTTRIDDVAEDPEASPLFEFTRSQLAVPIRSGGEVVAVVIAESDKVRGFDRGHVLTLETLADGIGIILRNADLYEDLQQTNVRLLDADRLKTEVVNLVAHDFRSPLAGILGFAELLAERTDAPATERTQNAQAIIDGVNYLSSLVDKTLKSTRLQSGQFPFHFDIVDLGAVVRGVLARLPPDPARTLVVDVSDDPLPLWGDRERLTEVVENLVSNAFKYTPPGGKITVVAAAEGADATVRVSDTGVGLAASDLDRVFRPFTRFKNRRSDQAKGFGLGLAICQRIVRAHGGRLSVKSAENTGSEFSFAIPLYGTAAQTQGPVVVLATADGATRRLAREVLRTAGYEVLYESDGVGVVEAARRVLPAAVFIDRVLPQLGAEDIAERLKLSRSTASIPIVVFLGALESLPDFDLFRAVLRKPLQVETLVEALPGVLNLASN